MNFTTNIHRVAKIEISESNASSSVVGSSWRTLTITGENGETSEITIFSHSGNEIEISLPKDLKEIA